MIERSKDPADDPIDPREAWRVPRGTANFLPGLYEDKDTGEVQRAAVENGRVMWFDPDLGSFDRIESTDSAQASLLLGAIGRVQEGEAS
jgi:hypothetical protein